MAAETTNISGPRGKRRIGTIRTHSYLFSSLAFLLGDFGQDGCNECNAFQCQVRGNTTPF